MLLPFGGKVPRDEGAVFVAPNATVLGDVVLGPGSSVWYGAVLRGDDGTLTLGENTNVQDNAVLHCDPGGAVTLGKNVTVGHCALVHGWHRGRRFPDRDARHPAQPLCCGQKLHHRAGALVPEGKIIPDDSLVVGVPGKIIKQVSPEQAAASLANAAHYVGRAAVMPQPCGKRKKVKPSERNNFVRSLTEFSQDFTRK